MATTLARMGSECREFVENNEQLKNFIQRIDGEINDAKLRLLANDLSAIANETRLKILYVLATSPTPLPLCVVAAFVGKEPQAITYHMRILKQRGLVREEQRDRFKLYTVDREKVRQLLEALSRLAEYASGQTTTSTQ